MAAKLRPYFGLRAEAIGQISIFWHSISASKPSKVVTSLFKSADSVCPTTTAFLFLNNLSILPLGTFIRLSANASKI